MSSRSATMGFTRFLTIMSLLTHLEVLFKQGEDYTPIFPELKKAVIKKPVKWSKKKPAP